jgi:hypothetical protein
MIRIEQFLQSENENVYLPKGWRVLNPLHNGLLEVSVFSFFVDSFEFFDS